MPEILLQVKPTIPHRNRQPPICRPQTRSVLKTPIPAYLAMGTTRAQARWMAAEWDAIRAV